MKRLSFFIFILLVFLVCSTSCKKEPKHVTVQHILIAFEGSIPKETVTRTQEEAEKLALEVYKRAKKGEDFDKLVKEYTDDQYPGVYGMSNFNVESDQNQEESSRSQMVKAFGDVSFRLSVNGIGLAEYDPEDSKYGWHIIKRIK
jgi:peptidyl-prolyl cis-trans isomerase C